LDGASALCSVIFAVLLRLYIGETWRFLRGRDGNVITDCQRFVAEHGTIIFAAAWRILAHSADVEDVVQEVFLDAYRLQQSQAVAHWPALLRRMATCRALDRLRRRRHEIAVDSMALLAHGPTPEDEAIGRELEERLRHAIAQLPQREAEVFCLRYFEQLTHDQIATLLRITTHAVSTALHKARTRLGALLSVTHERE
jgi:RNA polymerase sigma-70 factor, ECF subfamily